MGSLKKVAHKVGDFLGDPTRSGSQGRKEIAAGYDKAVAELRPWEQFGKQYGMEGIKQLQNDPNSITNLPFFQFQLDQGIEAINRKAAAAGFRGSGNVLYELQQFGQGLASQSYADEFNRRYNIAQLGQQSSSDIASLYTNQGRDIGGSRIQQGAQERGYIHDVGMSFLSMIGGGKGGGGAKGGGGGGGGGMFGLCWVAEELYGSDSIKTYTIRKWAMRHLHDASKLGVFLRQYAKYGLDWVYQIRTDKQIALEAKKKWDSMYVLAERENAN